MIENHECSYIILTFSVLVSYGSDDLITTALNMFANNQQTYVLSNNKLDSSLRTINTVNATHQGYIWH